MGKGSWSGCESWSHGLPAIWSWESYIPSLCLFPHQVWQVYKCIYGLEQCLQHGKSQNLNNDNNNKSDIIIIIIWTNQIEGLALLELASSPTQSAQRDTADFGLSDGAVPLRECGLDCRSLGAEVVLFFEGRGQSWVCLGYQGWSSFWLGSCTAGGGSEIGKNKQRNKQNSREGIRAWVRLPGLRAEVVLRELRPPERGEDAARDDWMLTVDTDWGQRDQRQPLLHSGAADPNSSGRTQGSDTAGSLDSRSWEPVTKMTFSIWSHIIFLFHLWFIQILTKASPLSKR